MRGTADGTNCVQMAPIESRSWGGGQRVQSKHKLFAVHWKGKTVHKPCEGEEGGKKRMEKKDEEGGGGRRKRCFQLHGDIYCGLLCYDTM